MSRPIVWLARHGETEWSRDLRHTGLTDIPLTEKGEDEARSLRAPLAEVDLDRVLCSPLSRARQTCELAGLGDRAELRDGLVEWDYGDYEGITSEEIREDRPDWVLWRDGVPRRRVPGADRRPDRRHRGRAARCRRCHARPLRPRPRAEGAGGALARPRAPPDGRLLKLGTGTLSRLGWEHQNRVIESWNAAV